MEWFGSTHSSYQILFSILFSTADSTPSLVGGIRHSDATWNCHEIITARSQCSKIKDCWKKKQESLGNPTSECIWSDDSGCCVSHEWWSSLTNQWSNQLSLLGMLTEVMPKSSRCRWKTKKERVEPSCTTQWKHNICIAYERAQLPGW